MSKRPAPKPETPEPFLVERDFAGRQYIGQREQQEDYYAFSDISDRKATRMSKLLVALGDGLGAHVGGNVASYFLVKEFIKAFKRSTLSPPWRMRVSLEAANEGLSVLSNRFALEKLPMGSTFVGLVITPTTLHWISVGDSLLYVFRAGKLTRLNADHSLTPILQERVARGEMTAEQALVHPDRHVLQSACMGLPLTMVDARMDPYELQSGDVIITASDGLLTLPHAHMEEMLTFGRNTTAGKIADALLFSIRCADEPRQDNATVTVVKIR